MSKKTRIMVDGKWESSTELGFSSVREDWNEYSCEDGSAVRIKLVATKIHRLNRKDANGEPIFLVRSSNVVDVSRSPDEEEVH